LRNPLAEPYLLGLSAGASTGAVLVGLLGFGSLALSMSGGAFIGALAAFALVLMLARAAGRGTRVFDRTEIIREDFARGTVTLKTGRGFVIRARRVVMALGYEIPRLLRRDIVRLSSTYALVSEPVPAWTGWEDRCLVWESARPYHYLRTTGDGRALIGGEDQPFRDPGRRDRMLPRKIHRLSRRLAAMLPGLRAEPAFGWTGTFGSTADGLPYIGESAEAPGRIAYAGRSGSAMYPELM